MELTVRLFASLKAKHGDCAVLELPETARISDLRKALEERGVWVSGARVAVNHSFASDYDTVEAQDEVAVIPPVSGG